MNRSKLALFISGLFFGGAINHRILAMMGSDLTPHGVHAGRWGNGALAVLDLALTALLYLLHHRLENYR